MNNEINNNSMNNNSNSNMDFNNYGKSEFNTQFNSQVNQFNNNITQQSQFSDNFVQSNQDNYNTLIQNNSINNVNGNKSNSRLIIKIGIGVVIAIIVIFIVSKLLKGSNTGTSSLPKKMSEYAKICTLEQDYEDSATINMTFGIYEKNNQIMQDNVIIWNSKNGKINIPSGSTSEEVVDTFAMFTGMMISFDGGTNSNQNNYYKNGKVYLTNTIIYNSDKFSSIDMLVDDLISSGATCK